MTDAAAAFLNVAATVSSTMALGPGVRAAVWVQGCPFRCAGCVSPEFIPARPSRLVPPEDLLPELLVETEVSGFTFSGGEPMLQAAGLAELISLGREQRNLNLICFTGFRLQTLRDNPPGPGVDALLKQTDVLIDGLYERSLDDGHGLRGSSNQRVIHLSESLTGIEYDWHGRVRSTEVRVEADRLYFVGVPPAGMVRAMRDVEDRVRRLVAPNIASTESGHLERS